MPGRQDHNISLNFLRHQVQPIRLKDLAGLIGCPHHSLVRPMTELVAESAVRPTLDGKFKLEPIRDAHNTYRGVPTIRDSVISYFTDAEIFTASEAAKKIGCSRCGVTRALRTMMAHKQAAFVYQAIVGGKLTYYYTIKHRDSPALVAPSLSVRSGAKTDTTNHRNNPAVAPSLSVRSGTETDPMNRFWFKKEEHAT